MGIGKMVKANAPEPMGKMARERYGIGKMRGSSFSEDRSSALKASDDIEKMIKSKK